MHAGLQAWWTIDSSYIAAIKAHLGIVVLGICWPRWVNVEAGKQAESVRQQTGEVVEQHFKQGDQQPAS